MCILEIQSSLSFDKRSSPVLTEKYALQRYLLSCFSFTLFVKSACYLQLVPENLFDLRRKFKLYLLPDEIIDFLSFILATF